MYGITKTFNHTIDNEYDVALHFLKKMLRQINNKKQTLKKSI